MMNIKKFLFAFTVTGCICNAGFAQEADTRGYNPLSVRPIHESDIMFKKTVWQVVDLREKQNRPLMASNNEITKVIIDAVKAGLLTPYTSDSVNTPMPIENFVGNMSQTTTQVTLTDRERNIQQIANGTTASAAKVTQIKNLLKKGGTSTTDLELQIQGVLDDSFSNNDQKIETIKGTFASTAPVEYKARDFTSFILKEDVIFDKQRSRLYWDTQALTMILATEDLDKPVASFRYKDLVRIFRSNPNAIWFNSQNNAEHKNLADAFDMRLFSGRITKVSNPDDNDLVTIYDGDRRGLLASDWVRQQLMEFEHNLWEF
ncbi:gliding motility protein GldN [Rhodocytophaga rosea]|uniref:Gliding motility protein GldN n=1 Tax=Rhodocytophaga rosea TaxID=2704465 RepID=A0A6C0GN08_9BACT|nr:gliding motility protein GldN [Rhodocytophaga rosea]QHT69020.1 gliding motility protein GldN [Rhodocytophaga rosea]